MVHQFDDRMYANCMQQQQPQHRQSLSASLSYLVTRPLVSRSTGAVDYGMYPGSGHTACSDDVITGRLATSICHQQQAVSYVNDAPPTNHHLHHQSSSSLHHQHQQHYTDYERHQMNSKCLRLGPGEDRQTSTCWTSAYPSLTADVHDSPAAWPTTIGRAYDNYMSTDDSLDMLHHQLLNQDCRTSPSDNDFMYHQTVSCDNSATAPVTMTTDPTAKYRLQPKPDTADAVSVVKQHLMDLESGPHHVQTSESAWMQPEAAFGWMKKQDISPITLTGKTRTKEKYRIVYTEQQKIELEKEFLFNQYITIQRKAELAGSIGLSDRQVKIWFQNRRAKERKSRRKHVDQGTEVDSTGRGVASGAPAAMGVAKAAPAGEQLQAPHFTQPQYRDSDVIKLESCSHDNVTSSTPQHTPWL